MSAHERRKVIVISCLMLDVFATFLLLLMSDCRINRNILTTKKRPNSITYRQHSVSYSINSTQIISRRCQQCTSTQASSLYGPAVCRNVYMLCEVQLVKPSRSDRHSFNGLFLGQPIWILMNQEMTGWQWHQLDHMQITCTSLQTGNHASISSLSYLQTACSSSRPTNSVKAMKNEGNHTLTADTHEYTTSGTYHRCDDVSQCLGSRSIYDTQTSVALILINTIIKTRRLSVTLMCR